MTITEKAAIAAEQATESLMLNGVQISDLQTQILEEAIAAVIRAHLQPDDDADVNAAEMYS